MFDSVRNGFYKKLNTLKFVPHRNCPLRQGMASCLMNLLVKKQLQGKDDIQDLDAQIKHHELDGLKVENVSLKRSHTRKHRIASKSVNARRAADHNRKLNFVDHNQFVIRSLKSVNTKTPQAKHSMNHTKKVWKATRNHNVNITKIAWRPIERFTDCKLSDRKAGSKGLTLKELQDESVSGSKGRTVADSIAERLTRPTAYKFKTDCSIIPVWAFYGIRGTSLSRAGKPVKKVLLMNLSDHRDPTQFLLLTSNLAFIPSPKLRFALSTSSLVCGCLTEAKC
ncbi:hypothetical protein Tco_0699145 [Tanacetum coccineum]